METYQIKQLSFSYPQQEGRALDRVELSVGQGEFVVICGPSGCGKSTLLRQLKPVLSPKGVREGEILFEGAPLDGLELRAQSEKIGFVQQAPEHQLVTDKVWHELAFGPESLGWDTPTIRRRVAEMASFFGMEDWFYREVDRLSGGQKQLLNLAAVMVMSPSVLILDEPTGQLDPIAARELLEVLGRINRELGTTVILTEHRLEEVLPMATKVAAMDGGRLLCVGTPREVGRALRDLDHPMFLSMPAPMRVWAATGDRRPCPLTVREGRDWLAVYAADRPLTPLPPEEGYTGSHEVALRGKGLWFRYEREGPDVVKGLELEVRRGELFALLGGNGGGKTTCLKVLAGLLQPYRGSVRQEGSVGVLPQDPQTLLMKNTLLEDLFASVEDRGLSREEEERRVKAILRLCRLEGLAHRHPYDLSGGEQQRAALGKVLLLEPEILLMDEPTKGLDTQFKECLGEILRQLLDGGIAVFMVSHDVEFCARYAHTCALFFDGSIVTGGSPRAFFSGNSFYTTGANRMARPLISEGVTAEELILACTGSPPPPPARREEELPAPKVVQPTQRESPPTVKRAGPGRGAMAAACLILLLIPLTLYLGQTLLGGDRYNLIALLVLLEGMLPFFILFEGRRPKARELVVIAVLCALGAAGRAAFFMLPQFKPVTALTILAGVALGGEVGFLVGALSMLTSNILFAQGPWTPWQMFAMGLMGFLAGVLFRRGRLRRERDTLCIFGAFAAAFLYGGIMNTSSALIWAGRLDWAIVLPYLISGLPMDCIHGGATGLFLWLGAEPVLEKLERIREKYGLWEQENRI